MAKINFTKAENALADAMHKRMVEQLLELADTFSENSASSNSAEDNEITKKAKERSAILYALYCDLGRLQRLDREAYRSLEFKKESLEVLMKNLAAITDEEWEKVLEAKALVETQLKKISDSQALQSNEDIINAQQKRSVNQRFNVSKRWIPLE
jgi:hypothetical protein